jgi:hypothetical protein
MPEPITTKDGVRQYAQGWFTAFPDMGVKQTNRVVSDEAVAAEVQFTGTNTGPMMMAGKEITPTGKTVVGKGTYFARVKGGKGVEFRRPRPSSRGPGVRARSQSRSLSRQAVGWSMRATQSVRGRSGSLAVYRVGTVRVERPDWILVRGRRHVERVLAEYVPITMTTGLRRQAQEPEHAQTADAPA